jgi:hypothetical protein
MVYANADIPKAEQAREVIAFADYWQHATGADPGRLVFDSQLTTDAVLDERTTGGIRWLILRQRGKSELARLAALPACVWNSTRIDRAGRYAPAARGHDLARGHQPQGPPDRHPRHRPRRTHPADHQRCHHPRRSRVRLLCRAHDQNELDAYIFGFHLDALSSGVPLAVDLDTTLTVIAGNLYRMLAGKLTCYETATPDKLWRHFLDATGTLHITDQGVTCALNLCSHHRVLIDAGFADLDVPIPWWGDRTLRFRFPPR